MRQSCLTRQLAFVMIAVAMAIVGSESCFASGGGSWGGSWGGSLGSRGFAGGSWGGSVGGFRTPVRNFFAYGRSVRLARRGNAFGSYGSIGYGSGGHVAGGSYGSAGGYGSAGYQYYSSSAGFAYRGASSSAAYAGTTFVATPASSYSYGLGGSSMSAYPAASSICPDCAIDGMSGITIDANAISPSTIPYTESSVFQDGSTVLESGPITGDQYYDSGGALIPSEGSGSSVDESGVRGFDTPPTPEPENSDETTSRRGGDAILNVSVPLDAKVYVNNRLTKTGGQSRSYVSRRMNADRDYTFNVEAVVKRNGEDVSLKRPVVMRAGRTQFVEFDFAKPVLTQLTVKVPENASVKLCGNDTSATGSVRNFKTKLMPGKVWQNYDISVSVEQDGETVTEKRTITIKAGQNYVVDFGNEKDLYVSK